MSLVSSNYTVDDSSPFLAYSPYADGFDIVKGWQSWYSESGFSTQAGVKGQGVSYHITSLSDATIQLRFNGVGISLHGASNASYDVTLDSDRFTTLVSTEKSDILYSNNNLAAGLHTITLTSRAQTNNHKLFFDRAVVQVGTNFPGVTIDHSNDTAIAYTGGPWRISTINGATYHTTVTDTSSLAYKFNGSAIAVHGLATSLASQYSVTLDGQTSTYNASATWDAPDALFYRADNLNPRTEHKITVTKVGGIDSILAFRSLAVFGNPVFDVPKPVVVPPSKGSKSNTALIGGSVGGAAGLLLLLGLVFFLWRRSHRSRLNFTSKPEISRPIPYKDEVGSPGGNRSRFSDASGIFPTRAPPRAAAPHPQPTSVSPAVSRAVSPPSSAVSPSPSHPSSPLSPYSQRSVPPSPYSQRGNQSADFGAQGHPSSYTQSIMTAGSSSQALSHYGSEAHLMSHERSASSRSHSSITRERASDLYHDQYGHGPRRIPSRTNQSSRSSTWKPPLDHEDSPFPPEADPSSRRLPPMPSSPAYTLSPYSTPTHHQYPPSPSASDIMSPYYAASIAPSRYTRSYPPTSEDQYASYQARQDLDRIAERRNRQTTLTVDRMTKDTAYFAAPPPMYQA